MDEFDLPCTDCGTALVERTVPAGLLPVDTTHGGEVPIAVCTDSETRQYPDATLAKLSTESRNQEHTNHA